MMLSTRVYTCTCTFLFIQSRLQDHVMVLGVLCLVLIDLAILGTYTLVEGLRGNLGVERITNREFPEETIGVSHVLYTLCFVFRVREYMYT